MLSFNGGKMSEKMIRKEYVSPQIKQHIIGDSDFYSLMANLTVRTIAKVKELCTCRNISDFIVSGETRDQRFIDIANHYTEYITEIEKDLKSKISFLPHIDALIRWTMSEGEDLIIRDENGNLQDIGYDIAESKKDLAWQISMDEERIKFYKLKVIDICNSLEKKNDE